MMNNMLWVLGIVASLSAFGMSAQSSSLTGTVERVWEDGFAINTGDRTTNVDAWEVCGDNTQQHIAVGDELTVEGEFVGSEFDAFAITQADGEDVCPSGARSL